MNSIGIDLHSSTVFMVALNKEGKTLFARERETSAPALIELLQLVPGPRQVMIEECHMTQWAFSVLKPFADKLVVCEPRENSWIYKSERNDDRTSAHKLADLLRMGMFKEVYHGEDEIAELRSLYILYADCTQDIVRCKNRVKAAFRCVAVRPGSGVYSKDKRSHVLEKLKDYKAEQFRAESFLRQLDDYENLRDKVFAKANKLARKNSVYKLLKTIPGVGDVIATGYIATIATAHRFGKKSEITTYAGFSPCRRDSGAKNATDTASYNGNRLLKCLVSQQFNAATKVSKDNRFKRHYLALLERGVQPGNARRNTCRRIIDTVRAIWISAKAYDDTHVSRA